MIRMLLGFLSVLGGLPGFALVTAYVSFEHPEAWKCELSNGIWICQSTLEADRREAIILSIATPATKWDSTESYLKYLSEPKSIQTEDGRTIKSKITYTRKRNINGYEWVDSLQQNSELPGFWTRYLATVQNKLAILITYIVSESRYSALAPQFERMAVSLKPNAEFDLSHATKQMQNQLPGSAILGQKDILYDRLNVRKTSDEATEKKNGGGTTLLALMVLGVASYLFYRRIRAKRAAARRQEPTS